MTSETQTLQFDSADVLEWLQSASDQALDELPFGVIGFDADCKVRQYNRYESQAARFEPDRVLGKHVFVELAPCMNNYLVGGRFDECHEQGKALDEIVPYVLTLRMKPTPVRLRLLARPGESSRFILVDRTAPSQA